MCCGLHQNNSDVESLDPALCDSDEKSTESPLSNHHQHVRHPFSSKHISLTYELESCQGEDIHFFCNVTRSRKFRVTWRRASDDVILSNNKSLFLHNVHRVDSGIYICKVTEFSGCIVITQVHLTVQFPPIITVPTDAVINTSFLDIQILCVAGGNPPAMVTWSKDNVPITDADDLVYQVSSETRDCITASILELSKIENSSSSDVLQGNFTCTASNSHGQSNRSFILNGPSNTTEEAMVEVVERRKFNVSGFIIGMLPPLFISFYIILKLGYRSRYAEERGEEDGVREEPFFISY